MNKICCKCKQDKTSESFCVKSDTKDKLSYECKECHAKYHKKWYKKNKQQRKQQIKERKREIVIWFKEFKSTLKCERCSENDSVCLDFHHLDSREKDLEVSFMAQSGWSQERIKKEIDKCIVLCSNCHRKEHHKNAPVV